MMGAIAFQKDLGAVHLRARAGAVCDLHHGLANALMIDTVMAWNHEAVPKKFDALATCVRRGQRRWLRALVARPQGRSRHPGRLPGPLRGARAPAAPGARSPPWADICHQTNPPCTASRLRGLFLAAM